MLHAPEGFNYCIKHAVVSPRGLTKSTQTLKTKFPPIFYKIWPDKSNKRKTTFSTNNFVYFREQGLYFDNFNCVVHLNRHKKKPSFIIFTNKIQTMTQYMPFKCKSVLAFERHVLRHSLDFIRKNYK